MCFNYKISILTTINIYSAVYYILKNKLYKNKAILYLMIVQILTSGLIEPLEGIIHYDYEVNKRDKDTVKRSNRIALKYLVASQSFSVIVSYILIGMKKKHNLLLIFLLLLHYVLFSQEKIDDKIEVIKSGKIHKLYWYYEKDLSFIYSSSVVVTSFAPLFSSFDRVEFRIAFFYHVISIIMIQIYKLRNKNSYWTGSLWCLFSSNILWTVISSKKVLPKFDSIILNNFRKNCPGCSKQYISRLLGHMK